jgi:hypothetical protein
MKFTIKALICIAYIILQVRLVFGQAGYDDYCDEQKNNYKPNATSARFLAKYPDSLCLINQPIVDLVHVVAHAVDHTLKLYQNR